jgi:hypothetical protein
LEIAEFSPDVPRNMQAFESVPPAKTELSVADPLLQAIYNRLAGYEERNDDKRLSLDRLSAGSLRDRSGNERWF